MLKANFHHEHSGPAVEAYLLGTVDFASCQALQQRLVYESTGRLDGQIALLICEHPAGISVGRQGSRSHIQLGSRELESRRWDVRWVNRGGGCVVHGPGQLGVYPIVPLEWHGWSVGEYLNRLQTGILGALAESRFVGQTHPGRFGIWGRNGQVVSFGAAVKSWVSYHGAFVNVTCPLQRFHGIETDPVERTPMSSLLVERQQPVRMTAVRESLVRRLSTTFGCERYHIYTGHPLLVRTLVPAIPEDAARVG